MDSKNNSIPKLSEKRDHLDGHPSLENKSKEFILFCKVQGAMRFVPDFPETCKAILNAVMEEMDEENCSLILKDPTTGELSIRVARGKNERESVYYPGRSSNWKKSPCARASLGAGSVRTAAAPQAFAFQLREWERRG